MEMAFTHTCNTVIYATHNNFQPKQINDTSPILYRLVSSIYLGWELLCVAYITVLHVCVKAISILSASFLWVGPILHIEI